MRDREELNLGLFWIVVVLLILTVVTSRYAHAGVSDGQPVSAAVTNAAFMDKNTTTTFTTALADIQGGIELKSANDSTSTGSLQNITLSAPITTFTNGSLASIQNFTFTNRTDATMVVLKNATGATITIKHLSGGTASLQIDTGIGTDFQWGNNNSISLYYDTVASKWQMRSPTIQVTQIDPQAAGSGSVLTDVGWTKTPTLGTSGQNGTIFLNGGSSGQVTIKPQSAAGTYNFNLPITAGSAGNVLTSQGGGSTAMTWTSPLTNPMTTTGDIIYSSDNSGTAARLGAGTNYFALMANSAATNKIDYENISSPQEIMNCSFTAAVASHALTITITDGAGSTPSGTSICKIVFRNSTLTTGSYTEVAAASGPTTVVVSNGSALGCTASSACTLYVYAINNAGAIEAAVIGGTQLDEGVLQTSTAEGGAGAADAYGTLYSNTARSSKAIRLLGRINITPAASFAWDNAATSISPVPLAVAAVQTSSLGVMKIEGAYITSGTAINQQSGSPKWLSSLTNNATGDSTLTIITGVFSAQPYCICTAVNASTPNGRVCKTYLPTTTSVRVVTTIDSTDAAAAENYNIICFGPG